MLFERNENFYFMLENTQNYFTLDDFCERWIVKIAKWFYTLDVYLFVRDGLWKQSDKGWNLRVG